MNDTKQIKEYIRACEHMIRFFNKMLNQNIKSLLVDEENNLTELTDLRILARTKDWTEAIDESKSAVELLRLFIETISMPIKNKIVLEFGSCESELAALLKNEYFAKKVVSFDLNLCKYRQNTINDTDVIYTDNFRLVQQAAPYDMIVINDILDHTDKPTYWLKQLKPLLLEKSRVFIRFHPYTSKNGTHLGEQINKAFLHLAFNDDELATFGVANRYTRKITDLDATYDRLIEESDFKIVNKKFVKTPVDAIFLTDKRISNRIKKELMTEKGMSEILEVEYIDYEIMI